MSYVSKQVILNVYFAGMGSMPMAAEEEDLSEYKFSKFAATYFQGQATPTYIKRQLKQPLLGLKNQQDKVVCATCVCVRKRERERGRGYVCALCVSIQGIYIYVFIVKIIFNDTSLPPQAALEIWIMILRFMGDLPEPKAPTAIPEVKEHGSLARRLKGSIGRKLSATSKPVILQQR